VVRATWRCYELTESEFAHHLGDILTSPTPRAGVYVRPGVVELRLEVVIGQDADAAETLLAAAGSRARERLPVPVYDDSVPIAAPRLMEALAARGETLSIAESLTGGVLAAELTAVPGASTVVMEGQVVYTDEAKVRLGVDAALLEAQGAVSDAVARALAEASRRRTGATWGIGLTGFAGPSGGTATNPVGTYYCAVAGPHGTVVLRRRTRSGREVVRLAAAETARFLLARAMTQGDA
jgi:nicotinamide-nucleotide amidase